MHFIILSKLLTNFFDKIGRFIAFFIDQVFFIKEVKSIPVTTEKDGHYFLKILEKETKRLLRLADTIENELETIPNLSEEVKGKLRAASGKARLLSSQKMQQFKGLCTNNITQVNLNYFLVGNSDYHFQFVSV